MARRSDSLIYPYSTECGWGKKWRSIKHRAKLNDIEFNLSFDEYLTMLYDANITSLDQVGQKPHQYAIGRYGDTGGYVVGNCRYITVTENVSERDDSKIGRGGKSNYQFKGYFHTPNGKFDNKPEAAISNDVSERTVFVRCVKNTNKVISKSAIVKDDRLVIGKTFKQCGWCFDEVMK
jgi:hypothetical protein